MLKQEIFILICKKDEKDNFLQEFSQVYKVVFNSFLMIQHELMTPYNFYNKEKDYEVLERVLTSIKSDNCNVKWCYNRIKSTYKSYPSNIVECAVMDSLHYYKKWRTLLRTSSTSKYPKFLQLNCTCRFFKAGTIYRPVNFSDKGLYLPQIDRFTVIENKNKIPCGFYQGVKIRNKVNSNCFYCEIKLSNRIKKKKYSKKTKTRKKLDEFFSNY